MQGLLSYYYGITLFLFANLMAINMYAQNAIGKGIIQTNEIHADSNIFVGWASQCTISRGAQQIGNPSLGLATFGLADAAIGKADNSVVSLGDGGTATLQFQFPLRNGSGYDFAVFENGFSDLFLELAHVEVSSNGAHFVRFPSSSLTQTHTQIGPFGTLDYTNIHNLAGKYRVYFGTPFDLNDLTFDSLIDLQHITHIRIVDAVGSINPQHGTYDSGGRIINEPWPTPFPSSGFDLDAVGVIHDNRYLGLNAAPTPNFSVFPNPFDAQLTLLHHQHDNTESVVEIFDIMGKKIFVQVLKHLKEELNLHHLQPGVYILKYHQYGVGESIKIVKK